MRKKGEVSKAVLYDKVLEIAQTYLPPALTEEVAPAPSSQAINIAIAARENGMENKRRSCGG